MKKFKELWKNPRYHALMVLGFYLVFFAFTFLFIYNMNSNKVPVLPKTELEYFEEITKYTVKVIGEEEFIMDEKGKVTYLNESYTIDTLPLELQKYQVSFINPKMIYQMIQKATLQSTNYIDKIDTYLLTKEEFLDLTNLSLEKDIIIDVYKEEQIKKIILDMEDYQVIVEEKE